MKDWGTISGGLTGLGSEVASLTEDIRIVGRAVLLPTQAFPVGSSGSLLAADPALCDAESRQILQLIIMSPKHQLCSLRVVGTDRQLRS